MVKPRLVCPEPTCPRRTFTQTTAEFDRAIASCWFAVDEIWQSILKLGAPVPASRNPPGPASRGLKLGHDPVATPGTGPFGIFANAGFAVLGELTTLLGVRVEGSKRSSSRSSRSMVACETLCLVVTGHRPDRAMPQAGLGHRMSDHKILCSHTSRLGPRSLRRLSLQLLLPGRGLGPTCLNPSSVTFKELPFPVPDPPAQKPAPSGLPLVIAGHSVNKPRQPCPCVGVEGG